MVPTMPLVEVIGITCECLVEENLKAFTHHLGEWISWEFHNNKNFYVFNLIVLLFTYETKTIKNHMAILVKGIIKFLYV